MIKRIDKAYLQAEKYSEHYYERLTRRFPNRAERSRKYHEHANNCLMMSTRGLLKRYPRLRRHYQVDAFGYIQPYLVNWEKVQEHLKVKRIELSYKLQESWIKEDRVDHKKRVFL